MDMKTIVKKPKEHIQNLEGLAKQSRRLKYASGLGFIAPRMTPFRGVAALRDCLDQHTRKVTLQKPLDSDSSNSKIFTGLEIGGFVLD